MLFNFILSLFKKKKKQCFIKEVVNLSKWEKLKRLPDTYIGDIFSNAKNIDDIAMALVHSDKQMIRRFFVMADAYRKDTELNDLIKKYSYISKEKSDKMKAHVANLSGIDRPGHIQVTLKDVH